MLAKLDIASLAVAIQDSYWLPEPQEPTHDTLVAVAAKLLPAESVLILEAGISSRFIHPVPRRRYLVARWKEEVQSYLKSLTAQFIVEPNELVTADLVGCFAPVSGSLRDEALSLFQGSCQHVIAWRTDAAPTDGAHATRCLARATEQRDAQLCCALSLIPEGYVCLTHDFDEAGWRYFNLLGPRQQLGRHCDTLGLTPRRHGDVPWHESVCIPL